MKLTFLGTNGWFSADGNNTMCTLLETEKNYIVFDAGDGIHKLDRYIKDDRPVFLFLSHLHLDHTFGFHILCKFKLSGLSIICPERSKDMLARLINHPYSLPIKDLTYPVDVVEVTQGRHTDPVSLECKKLFHIDQAFGYSLEIEGKKITYLCDTGVCMESQSLADASDVIIHECSLPPGVKTGDWGHSNPQEAANTAKKAGAKKLYLTHFSPADYETKAKRQEAQDVAREIFPETYCAEDDMTVKI